MQLHCLWPLGALQLQWCQRTCQQTYRHLTAVVKCISSEHIYSSTGHGIAHFMTVVTQVVTSCLPEGQCGVCYDITCVPGPTRGLPDAEFPDSGCISNQTISVMITDSCPCKHANKSNKKWCCGDMTHLDLSYKAFSSIADPEKGVINIMFERLPSVQLLSMMSTPKLAIGTMVSCTRQICGSLLLALQYALLLLDLWLGPLSRHCTVRSSKYSKRLKAYVW